MLSKATSKIDHKVHYQQPNQNHDSIPASLSDKQLSSCTFAFVYFIKILSADDLPAALPITQVRMKSYSKILVDHGQGKTTKMLKCSLAKILSKLQAFAFAQWEKLSTLKSCVRPDSIFFTM